MKRAENSDRFSVVLHAATLSGLAQFLDEHPALCRRCRDELERMLGECTEIEAAVAALLTLAVISETGVPA